MKTLRLIKLIFFQLASVHGGTNVGTTVHVVFMDLDVVRGVIVVISRHATPNKDASNVNKYRKIIVYE